MFRFLGCTPNLIVAYYVCAPHCKGKGCKIDMLLSLHSWIFITNCLHLFYMIKFSSGFLNLDLVVQCILRPCSIQFLMHIFRRCIIHFLVSSVYVDTRTHSYWPYKNNSWFQSNKWFSFSIAYIPIFIDFIFSIFTIFHDPYIDTYYRSVQIVSVYCLDPSMLRQGLSRKYKISRCVQINSSI